MDMKQQLARYAGMVNDRLSQMKTEYEGSGHRKVCSDAMWYSLSAGGKRIRPVLVMELCRLCGGDPETALDAACALEMIHTFSLIHDDLPCMDDDDMRRGRPSCHKAYGEAEALLAGDALENLAFGVIADDDKLSAEQRIKLISVLSRAVGINGMIGGQTIDLQNDGKPFSKDMLLEMYSMKTGALLKTACQMGCICAGKYDRLTDAEEYAESMGLAFQIIDDILDITSTTEVLGKPVGSDTEQNKATYPVVFGMEASKQAAEELTQKAVSCAERFEDCSFLKELTEYLLKRDN